MPPTSLLVIDPASPTTVQCIPGQANLGNYEMINFSFPGAYDTLSTFARAITQRWEGLVLKAYDGPYFSLNGSHNHIKLKKDYIPGLGDTADFAIVSGRRDTKVEQETRHREAVVDIVLHWMSE